MTNILAIDTSTAACSVAIRCGGETISKYQLASRDHTKLLLPMVDGLLSEASLTLSGIDAIAFTGGPGSFTGIRIGFGVVQGLAFGADIPVLPVSSLETLTHTAIRKLCLQENGQMTMNIFPMFDARMDEVYWSQFRLQSSGKKCFNIERICNDSLSAPENVLPVNMSQSSVVIVGDGWNYHERIPLTPSIVDKELFPDARDILSIAKPLFDKGCAIAVEEASPVYLRDKITWKKRQRLR